MFDGANFDAQATGKWYWIERRPVVFLCWTQDSNRISSRLNAHRQADWAIEDQALKLELNSPSLWSASIQPTRPHCRNDSPADWMPTRNPTDLPRIKSVTKARQPIPVMSQQKDVISNRNDIRTKLTSSGETMIWTWVSKMLAGKQKTDEQILSNFQGRWDMIKETIRNLETCSGLPSGYRISFSKYRTWFKDQLEILLGIFLTLSRYKIFVLFWEAKLMLKSGYDVIMTEAVMFMICI